MLAAHAPDMSLARARQNRNRLQEGTTLGAAGNDGIAGIADASLTL